MLPSMRCSQGLSCSSTGQAQVGSDASFLALLAGRPVVIRDKRRSEAMLPSSRCSVEYFGYPALKASFRAGYPKYSTFAYPVHYNLFLLFGQIKLVLHRYKRCYRILVLIRVGLCLPFQKRMWAQLEPMQRPVL